MKATVVDYRKTEEGPVVEEVREVDLHRVPQTQIERFHAFFENVPLHGGREWKTLSVDEIVSIFIDAASDIQAVHQKRREDAIEEHSRLNPITKFWREFRGWKAPEVPSIEILLHHMAEESQNLSDWMRSNQSRSFYRGSDMSDFIRKPALVAEKLRTK